MKLRPGVSVSDTDYGKVLLDERRGLYFQLNSTGSLILDLLSEGETETVIARRLSDEYEVSDSQALEDVRRLSIQLMEKGVFEE